MCGLQTEEYQDVIAKEIQTKTMEENQTNNELFENHVDEYLLSYYEYHEYHEYYE